MLRCLCSNADFYSSICRLKPGLIGDKRERLSSFPFIFRRVSIPNLTMKQKGRGVPAGISQSGLCGLEAVIIMLR